MNFIKDLLIRFIELIFNSEQRVYSKIGVVDLIVMTALFCVLLALLLSIFIIFLK